MGLSQKDNYLQLRERRCLRNLPRSKKEAIERGRQLKVVIKRNFGDMLRKCYVRLARQPVISDNTNLVHLNANRSVVNLHESVGSSQNATNSLASSSVLPETSSLTRSLYNNPQPSTSAVNDYFDEQDGQSSDTSLASPSGRHDTPESTAPPTVDSHLRKRVMDNDDDGSLQKQVSSPQTAITPPVSPSVWPETPTSTESFDFDTQQSPSALNENDEDRDGENVNSLLATSASVATHSSLATPASIGTPPIRHNTSVSLAVPIEDPLLGTGVNDENASLNRNISQESQVNAGDQVRVNILARRRRHAIIPHRVTYRNAIVILPEGLEDLCEGPYNCGSLTELCPHCGALYYNKEKASRDSQYTNCCNKGAYTIEPLKQCPLELKELYLGDGRLASQFRKNIRYLNSLFAMASFRTSQPIPERRNQGHWSFTICGQIYHYLDPIPNSQDLRAPRLNQIYFLDVDEALDRRNAFAQNRIDPNLIRSLESILRNNNIYIQAYKTMGEELAERRAQNLNVDNIIIGITKEPVINILAAQQNPQWRPGRSDIAAIFEGSEPPVNVDLVLYPHDPNDPSRHHELRLLNSLADPMVYPLLFPCGELGYQQNIRYNSRGGRQSTRCITILQYYRYRIYIRDVFSTIHHGGKLFQQYIIDGWLKAEMSRLWWFRQNQQGFRRTAEEVLRRYNSNRQDGQVGRAVILPSGFQGSRRYRQKQYYESMAIAARFGKPDLFITFTCNPKWSEITENLKAHQKWEDRPDLICRVFQMKLTEFMDDLNNKQLYGVVLNYQYVIEFQKRGLPHAHIVITFQDDDKLRDVEQIDEIICAQIPDLRTQPLLYGRVKEFQLHAPCGRLKPDASCMMNGKCSKYFPKPFREGTALYVGSNRRPEYKRPADGRNIYVEKWDRSLTNRRVVPYNPYALAKYECHINFEAVGSINTIKYLHKYINKEPDTVMLYLDRNNSGQNVPQQQPPQPGQIIDEIQYIDRRYVSGMEATWRIFQYRMHNRSHSVLTLPIHLPGDRDVHYDEQDNIEDVERRLEKPSKLEAWFSLNQRDVNARQYRYVEIPEHYSWDDRNASWRIRVQKSKQIGSLIEVSPNNAQMEKFFLRVLLKRLKGATSFDDLLTLENGYICETFRESCQRRNWLVEDGGEFERCLREAEQQCHPRKFRKLFSLICCVAMDEDVSQIPQLWNLFKKSLSEDYRHMGMNRYDAIIACMADLDQIIGRCRPGMSLRELGIVDSQNDDSSDDSDSNASDEGNLTDDEIVRPLLSTHTISSLNKEQKILLLRILNACKRKMGFLLSLDIYDELGQDVTNDQIVDRTPENIFYLDGPGGSGKTYLYNTLITVLNEMLHKKTIAVAWTGIAATILIGGTTVHRSFKLPLTLSEETTCGWDLESLQSRSIKNDVALIIWDEAPMTPRFAVEAVNRYLMDVMRRREPMGGKCVLFGGDFRQILPVVIGSRTNDILSQSLKASELWPHFTKLQLKENMRVARNPQMAVIHSDLNNCTFAEWLLRLGEGTIPFASLNRRSAPIAPDDLIEIPTRFQVETMEDLINFVYEGNFTSRENGTRAILCPTNAVVNAVNEIIIQQIGGHESKTYLSEDTYAAADDDDFAAPLDLLNAINLPSLPPHELTLKRWASVMLLRNLDVDEGQCNGSRMRVTMLGEHVIECELLTGQRKGEKFLLPRIKMKAQDPMLPKEIIRLQFPIRLAYAMTINKSQGQTLDRVGICLRRPCFTHGQLYVAFSRICHIDRVKIFIEDSGKQGTFKYRGTKRFTRNIVFKTIIGNSVLPQTRVLMPDPPDTDDEDSQDPNIPTNQAIPATQSDSDPDYSSSDDGVDQIMGDIDLGPLQVESSPRSVPVRSDDDLRRRISIYDRPGTSGINNNVTIADAVTNESDSDYSDS